VPHAIEIGGPRDGESLVSGGLHLGNTGLFVSLIYGQDLEGDDREGEVSFALLQALTARLQLGFEARSRFKLGSTDPKRLDHPTESLDAYVAPTLSYALGPLALFAETGPAMVRTTGWRFGMLVMAGVGGAL
jgi:hypothetical protein